MYICIHIYKRIYIQNRNRFIDITAFDYQREEGSEEG